MTDAEAKFVLMAKIGLPEPASSNSRSLASIKRQLVIYEAERTGRFGNLAREIVAYPESFPIVASTFAALCEERPELRPHYDRAKEAWETSQ